MHNRHKFIDDLQLSTVFLLCGRESVGSSSSSNDKEIQNYD